MVEVFKTNVVDPSIAEMLLDRIHRMFEGYRANFDLEDSDNILRVACERGVIKVASLFDLFKDYNVEAEILPDEIVE